MSAPANPHRGDVVFAVGDERYALRPSFQAIAAAESELGSLVALAARADQGITVAQLACLFSHCHRAVDAKGPEPDTFGRLILQAGLGPALASFQALMHQILHGGQDH